MNREAFLFLPPLNRRDVTSQVGGDLFPRLQPDVHDGRGRPDPRVRNQDQSRSPAHCSRRPDGKARHSTVNSVSAAFATLCRLAGRAKRRTVSAEAFRESISPRAAAPRLLDGHKPRCGTCPIHGSGDRPGIRRGPRQIAGDPPIGRNPRRLGRDRLSRERGLPNARRGVPDDHTQWSRRQTCPD